MKIVSFNTNSVRVRTHQIERIIELHSPDIIGLQETKVIDEEFPVEAIEALGYQSVFHGQKTHYGVAILSRVAPSMVKKGFDGDHETSQKRFIAAQFGTREGQDMVVVNGYFPQGESRNHPSKFQDKRRFYADLLQWLQEQYTPRTPILVMGDMNISPTDMDIGIGEDNRKRWLRDGKCSFLPEEREWLTRLYDWGLTDTFRFMYPEASDRFSWFDYRSRGFEREPKRGLRIDHILATLPLVNCCTGAGIDYQVRAMPKPSDHCPVWAEFALNLS